MTMIHVQFATQYDLRDIREANPSREHWLEVAKQYYRYHYNFDEMTSERAKWLQKHRLWLRSTCPPEYQEGVHLLFPHAAFMGEDIYIVDGRLQHPLHVRCTKCRRYRILWRNQWDPDTSTHYAECIICGRKPRPHR